MIKKKKTIICLWKILFDGWKTELNEANNGEKKMEKCFIYFRLIYIYISIRFIS